MWINGLQVTGTHGFSYSFGRSNILLGENGSGKSTFIKLILYALGARINSFIDEISKLRLCDHVHIDVTTKSNKRFLIIRKLPVFDQVTIVPYDDDDVLQTESVRILNLDEYSDFLLEEEGYSKDVITYAASKTASLTYRFLLRTALVDQSTPHNRILANVPGDKNDFMNSQELLNTAIIEKILDTLNQELQELRLALRQKENERAEVSSRIAFYMDLRDEFNLNTDAVLKKIEKVDKELESITLEKEKLFGFRYEQLRELEKTNNQNATNAIGILRKALNQLKEQAVQLDFEISDLKNMLNSFRNELVQIKKQLASQKVLMNIPVTICPICFSSLDSIEKTGLCSQCKNTSPQDILDSVAGYKRMIEETINELEQLIASKESEAKDIKAKLKKAAEDLSREEGRYIQELNDIRQPLENIVSEIQKRLQAMTEREYKLYESRQTLQQINVLKIKKDSIARDLEELRADIEEAERKSADEHLVFARFEEIFKSLFVQIYGEAHEVCISSDNFMPIIDGTSITQSNHSESIKVVAHLAYIISFFLLNGFLKGKKIKNLGFLMLDSPRDKDLDIDKYERLLAALGTQNEGQLFLTGSYKEQTIYERYFPKDSGCYIDHLTVDSKLLKKIEE